MRYALFILLLFVATAQAAPTTRPAGITPDVLVLPFEEIDANPTQAWIGQAIQQSLVADLSQMPALQPGPGEARAQREHAVEAAREAGARYVVLGSFQLVDPQLRITGQVIDATSGEVLGGLKSTGTVRDLFAMQDTIGTQAKRILNQATRPAETPASTEPAAPQPSVVRVEVVQKAAEPGTSYRGSGLQQAVQRGSVQQYARTYDYRYSYPGYYSPRYLNYTYGYPYYGGYPYYYGGYPYTWAWTYYYPGRIGIWNWCGPHSIIVKKTVTR